MVGGVPFYFRVIDLLLIPLMWVLSGFHLELPQESHKWHMQAIDCNLVDEDKGVRVAGDDKSRFDNRSPLNHIPILGGWQNYVVLEANGYVNYWNMAWKIKYINSDRQDKCEIQRLRLYSSRVKLLKGISDSDKVFFALNDKGEFIDIKIVGEGVLGDGRFRSVRLL